MYGRVLGVMVAAVALKGALAAVVPPEALHVEVHGVGAFVGVVGGLYGIIMAFLMFVVWDQFNRVQMGLTKEASALEHLCGVAGCLSEASCVKRIRLQAKQYVKSTAGDEPQRLAKRENSVIAREHFGALCQAVGGAEAKTERDRAVFDELLRALARVIEARDDRLSVSATRIPGTLWKLVVFVSFVLFAGFLVLGVRSFLLSLGVVAAVAGSITFLLSVIKDMDNPFAGAWNVSYDVMTAAARRIG